ncbi:hypothetical protein [Streptomyces sp. BF23-19]|uniref:hypothetical protein n=1 Tax=unclassified Streptomyces TaxID=2593676 RepID=UPI0034E507B7
MDFGPGFFGVDPGVGLEPPDVVVLAGPGVPLSDDSTGRSSLHAVTSPARATSSSGTLTTRLSRAPRVSSTTVDSTVAPFAPSRYRFTAKVALRSTFEVIRTVVTGGVAPTQVTTTAVAGAPLALAEGAAVAVAVAVLLLLLWLFFRLLELEHPPPLLLLLLLLPLLPPCDENPVSANTTATSTAVNLICRPATMARTPPVDNGGPRYQPGRAR